LAKEGCLAVWAYPVEIPRNGFIYKDNTRPAMWMARNLGRQTPPMTEMTLPVTTARLRLRPFKASDFAAYQAYHCLPEVYRYLYSHVPDATSLQVQFDQVVASRFTEEGDTCWRAVVRQSDDAVIGEVLLKLASSHARQAEVGYIFNPTYAGQGYATEAVHAMVTWGFDAGQFHRIFARLDALNTGSVGIVERLGFRREAHLVQNDCFDGRWGDEFIYAMLRRDWPVTQP
jgi:RimJ/RimL family protein N-acetyltransferase